MYDDVYVEYDLDYFNVSDEHNMSSPIPVYPPKKHYVPMSEMQRMAMVSTACCLVLLTMLIVFCVVCPGCICFNICARRRQRQYLELENKRASREYGTSGKALQLSSTEQQVESSASDVSTQLSQDTTNMSVASGFSWLSRASTKDSSSSTSSFDCSIAFTVHTTRIENDEEFINVILSIQNCQNLPCRIYGASVDAFVRIRLLRDRRSLRRRLEPQVLQLFNTQVIKKERNPCFNQKFEVVVAIQECKHLRLELTAVDADRHTRYSELGSTSITLKEFVKSNAIANEDEPRVFTQSLILKKETLGELLFGMSFMPTAKRLSFSIVKATNAKKKGFSRAYVRLLMVSTLDGRVVRKKKTGLASMEKEEWLFNETVNFDFGNHVALDSVVFVLMLVQVDDDMEASELESSASTGNLYATADEGSRPQSPSVIPSGRRSDDRCLGLICVGSKVFGEKERTHFNSVVAEPRKNVSMWHTLT